MLGQNSGKDMGHILENVVYLELKKMYETIPIGEIYEYKSFKRN